MNEDPCTPITVHGEDGEQLRIAAHGGHLVGWRPAGRSAQDLLWLSPMARCGPGEAIRGGVPVIFPQFAGRGPLPKHGLARDRTWTLSGREPAGGQGAGITARLTDSEATRAIWPHRFSLALHVRAAGDTLRMELSVSNDGLEPFTFTAALHTYLAAEAGSLLTGLDGAAAEDNAAALARTTLPTGGLDALAERDIAVRDHPGEVRLTQPDGRRITVFREGFADVVVWNPGRDHGLADAPPGQLPFVCLEPAALSPVDVAPAQTWTASATLEVTQSTRPR